MRMMLAAALLLLLLPATPSALTVQEVVALSKAGVSDEVLLSLIERDKTIFSIDSDQLIALTRDRVSEKLVLAMLRSGRQEPPPPPSPAANVTHAVPADPSVFMFGHGPTRPNTYHEFDQLGQAWPSVVYAVPYYAAPIAVPPGLAAVPCRPATTSASRTDRTVGLADASGKFVNNGLLPMLAAAGGGTAVCQPTPRRRRPG